MRFVKYIPQMLLVLFSLSGCNILGHLDEISVMSDYSKEKDAQHLLVKSINARYDALTRAIAQGHISDYKDKASFMKAFGDPILKKDLSNGTQQWLYRYAILRFAKDKVYVYFDHQDQMVKWEKVPCPSLF